MTSQKKGDQIPQEKGKKTSLLVRKLFMSFEARYKPKKGKGGACVRIKSGENKKGELFGRKGKERAPASGRWSLSSNVSRTEREKDESSARMREEKGFGGTMPGLRKNLAAPDQTRLAMGAADDWARRGRRTGRLIGKGGEKGAFAERPVNGAPPHHEGEKV